ncbi:MAG: hypothetical protein QM831_03165 [Kofleriaceae bacterium]
MSHDYQNQLPEATRDTDELGEKAADKVTVQNYGVKESDEVEERNGGHYHHSRGDFGMVDRVQIDLGFTHDRGAMFQNAAEGTGSQAQRTGNGSARDTIAFKSLTQMAANYVTDLHTLPAVQRDFDLFLPNANMAARSFTKTQAVANDTGFSTEQGPQMSAKEKAALATAGQANSLDETKSLKLASETMRNARLTLVGASHSLASVVKSESQKGLEEQLKTANERKEKIQKNIELAAKIGDYIEAGGTALAGGAGFVNEHLNPGSHEKERKAKEAEEDVQSDTPKTAETIGEGIEKGGSVLGKAAAFGVSLYYANELNEIKSKVAVVTSMLDAHTAAQNRDKIEGAMNTFLGAAGAYQTAVGVYEAAINERRKSMAKIGAAADKSLGGNMSHISDAMLYTTTLLETQSFLAVAKDSGTAAKSRIDGALYGADSVKKHREYRYGYLEDSVTENNTPRTEMKEAPNPDLKALKRMSDLVNWWMDGAQELSASIDKTVDEQARPMMGTAKYTGSY